LFLPNRWIANPDHDQIAVKRFSRHPKIGGGLWRCTNAMLDTFWQVKQSTRVSKGNGPDMCRRVHGLRVLVSGCILLLLFVFTIKRINKTLILLDYTDTKISGEHIISKIFVSICVQYNIILSHLNNNLILMQYYHTYPFFIHCRSQQQYYQFGTRLVSVQVGTYTALLHSYEFIRHYFIML